MQQLTYNEYEHKSAPEEWQPHRGVNEFWITSGYFSDRDDSKNLYFYKLTIRKEVHLLKDTFNILLSLTDISGNRHYAAEENIRQIYWDKECFLCGEKLQILSDNYAFAIHASTADFTLDICLRINKEAFWHGDNGPVIMGNPQNKKAKSFFYAYPNLATYGKIEFAEEETHLFGKSILEHQFGPFSLKDKHCSSQKFSLNFYDEEEIMLLHFPKNDRREGVYINHKGELLRLTDYTIEAADHIDIGKFSIPHGWRILTPSGKDETYRLIPLGIGHIHQGFYQTLASIFNDKNEHVGICLIEIHILP